ncbi:MAG TPA: PD-(D/E)XK nuclease family protein, partial [Stellaceae bacterium]|nr:PD-(D/E)XK nuclease family protein [Stellaceae bacterium]
WGLLEARLQRADLMILGGLNEGAWPSDPAEDPWMSRPMRRGFGIAPPERRIGEAAHDFALAMGAPEVVLTRAEREGGAPTLPSRWLLRLDAVLRAAGLADALTTERDALAWQAALDNPPPEERLRSRAPGPRPPVEVRPRSLSVTAIETWMRDPYAIYAGHILKLDALDRIDAEPDARERGVFIHQALDAFVRQFPQTLPSDGEARLLALGREKLGALLTRPGIWAFWWPRFERIARWFLTEEEARRAGLSGIATEVAGKLELSGPRGPFTLRATADRIERRGGELVIVDYKTGSVPAQKDIGKGLSPQLSLEAAIAEAGGFAGVSPAVVAALEFWRLSGLTTAGEVKTVAEGGDVAELIAEALAGLRDLIAKFDDPATPYLAAPDAAKAPRYSDYTHLERVKEWRASEGEPG